MPINLLRKPHLKCNDFAFNRCFLCFSNVFSPKKGDLFLRLDNIWPAVDNIFSDGTEVVIKYFVAIESGSSYARAKKISVATVMVSLPRPQLPEFKSGSPDSNPPIFPGIHQVGIRINGMTERRVQM